MWLYYNIFILSFIITLCVCEDVIIITSNGRVSGKPSTTLFDRKEYCSFFGIPYAEPPTGSSRFSAPIPRANWDGVYNAQKEKPACLQFNTNVKKGNPFGVYGAEDCLYLDVFTPARGDDDNLPVVVFLYNENFQNSYNKTKDYAPDFFVEEDVIIVTISHRLSVLGFLDLEDEILPGNSGIKDVILALKWVQNNIKPFGGNPKAVTLMGARGGADLVDFLLHTEKAKGLFSGVILQGGTAWKSMYLPGGARERAHTLAGLFGKSARASEKLLEKLSSIPASDLLTKVLQATPDDYYRENQRSIIPFGPNIEYDSKDAVISNSPESHPPRIDVPMMIGFNSREGLEGSFEYLEEPKFLTYVEREFPLILPLRTGFRFDRRHPNYASAVQDLKNLYFSDGKVKISKPSEYITYIGDVLAEYPIDAAVRSYSNSSTGPLYYFVFDYSGSLNENKNFILKGSKVTDGTWGAASGDELCYLFMCPDLAKTYKNLLKSKSSDIIVHRGLVRMWTNFVKYRNPTPSDDKVLEGFIWKPVTKENKNYLQIRDDLKMRINPSAGRIKFWDNFIKKYSNLAIDGVVGQVKDEL